MKGPKGKENNYKYLLQNSIKNVTILVKNNKIIFDKDFILIKAFESNEDKKSQWKLCTLMTGNKKKEGKARNFLLIIYKQYL